MPKKKIEKPTLDVKNNVPSTFYNIHNLLTTNARYMMLLGQRANGKSYQVKDTILTESAKENGKKFFYLRRWKEDVRAHEVEKYFDDINISKITHGEYDHIKAWQNKIYFAQYTDDKEVRGKEIGYYGALNEAGRYKSWAFTDPETGENRFKYIVYEEFITDESYLIEEPTRLQQFVSTVFRRQEGHVFLVGNTLSRVCPYFAEWSLENVLKQKQGTIEMYHYHTNDGETIDLAVEYCTSTNYKNTMFFGRAEKQIITGEWDTKQFPRLPKSIDSYEKVYELQVNYQGFKFVLQLLVEPTEGGVLTYIYPLTTERFIRRQISNDFVDDIFTTSKLDITKRPEQLIAWCFRVGKVCYSDNLTGTDFNHVLDDFKFI